MSSQEILLKAFKKQWFHSINFSSGITSPGRFNNRPQNYTLFGAQCFLEKINLHEKSCLDIGTMDGITAFMLKQAGAKKVVATDLAKRENFLAGMDYLGLDIEYHENLAISEMADKLEKFDLIVCCGVLYHVFEPLTTLAKCREQLKENGLLILETQYAYREAGPAINFSPADQKHGSIHANTFFRPSFSALTAMFETACLEPVASISNNGRITFLCKATTAEKLKTENKLTKKICKKYHRYKNYRGEIDYKKFAKEELSPIVFDSSISGKHYWLSSLKHHSCNTLQPAFKPSFKQKLRLQLSELRFKTLTSLARGCWLANWG